MSLKLYDLTGKLVTTIASGTQNAGHYSLPVDFASSGHGASALAHGVYLLKFLSGNYTTTQKLIVN